MQNIITYNLQLEYYNSNGYVEFYVHGTVHSNSMSITVQQDATIHSLFYL